MLIRIFLKEDILQNLLINYCNQPGLACIELNLDTGKTHEHQLLHIGTYEVSLVSDGEFTPSVFKNFAQIS